MAKYSPEDNNWRDLIRRNLLREDQGMPLRSIVSQYPLGGNIIALLVCGHEKHLLIRLRKLDLVGCRQCYEERTGQAQQAQ